MALNRFRSCLREVVNDDNDVDDEKEAENENDNLLGMTLIQTESVSSELHTRTNWP